MYCKQLRQFFRFYLELTALILKMAVISTRSIKLYYPISEQ